MRPISNITGPVSYGETSWETGNTPEATTGKSARQELIFQANTVPLASVLKHYGIRADNGRSNIPCPFKSHKGGRESTGSFRFYPSTNSFKCYGCGLGGLHAHSCDFVAAMESLTKEQAAIRIIKLFGDELDSVTVEEYSPEDSKERLTIMLDFSNTVREFRSVHFDEKSLAHIEYLCSVYDSMNFKRKLDNEALRRIVEELKEEINKPCPTP